MTPISIPEDFDGRLTGKVFEWTWVRLFSPLINLYAFLLQFQNNTTISKHGVSIL